MKPLLTRHNFSNGLLASLLAASLFLSASPVRAQPSEPHPPVSSDAAETPQVDSQDPTAAEADTASSDSADAPEEEAGSPSSTETPGAPSATPADAETGDNDAPAYQLAAGSFARSRIVALGRDLYIDGEARSHAVAISGDARIQGSVGGDLIVLGGTAKLGPSSRVDGDVYVLGGDIELQPGAIIGGRSVAYPEASDLWVALIEGPSLGLPAFSRVVIGSKLALLAFWTFLALCLLGVFGREILATSEAIQDEPFRHFFLGLTGVAALVLTALFFSAFAGALLGVPLLVLVVVVALVLRFWGMVAIFHAVGSWVNRRLLKRHVPAPLVAATWGLVALGLLKFLPYLGIWTWSVATFIGVGAALSTKLGRRDPWLEA